jgi:hypothetical protein
MYAVLITGVSAAVLVSAMPAATQAYTTAAAQEHAINLAEKEMEAIRNQGFPNINPTQLASVGLLDSSTAVATNTYTFNQVDSANNDNVAAILPQGSGSVLLQTVSLNLVQVTVTVNWVFHGQNQTYTLATEMANL